jgi:hypothetical protein
MKRLDVPSLAVSRVVPANSVVVNRWAHRVWLPGEGF